MSQPGIATRLGRLLRRAFADAIRAAGRRPLLPLASFGTLSVCLVLVGVVGLLAQNLGGIVRRSDGQMTVYLEDQTPLDRATQIAEAVRHLPGVVETRVVDTKEAHRRLRAALGSHGQLLDNVEEGFLPASIDVHLRPGVSALLRAHPGFERLRTAPGVEEVDLHAEGAERLDAIRDLVVRGALALVMLVAFATLYLVGATIRLGMEARREELAVLRMVGATETFVRAPFLVEGALCGALAAVASGGALYIIYRTVAPQVSASMGTWLASTQLQFFSPWVMALAMVVGTFLGLSGAAAACMRSHRA